MKKIIAAVFLFAVCCSVEAFTEDEIEEVICSIPHKYLLRFVGCTYDRSPAPFQKFANVIHQCVDEFYETDGRSDSVVLLMCGDVVENEDLRNCLHKNGEKIEHPTKDETEEVLAGAKNCLIEAK